MHPLSLRIRDSGRAWRGDRTRTPRRGAASLQFYVSDGAPIEKPKLLEGSN